MRGRRITYASVALAAVVAVGAVALYARGPSDDTALSARSTTPSPAPVLRSPAVSAPVSPSGSPSATPSKSKAPAKRTFPDAGSTGVPAGVRLSPYDGSCTVQDAGTVIDAADVRCSLVIKAARVVIRKSKITGTVKVEGAANSLRIEDSDIDGGEAYEHTVGFENLTVLRSDIRGGQSSVNCYHNCLIQDSYLHDQNVPDGEDWHLNAFLSNGGDNIKLIGNTLSCDHPTNSAGGGCTANASIFGDFAPNTDYTIQDNLFVASKEMSYCLYGGYDSKKEFGTQVKHIVVVSNVFQRGGNGKCGGYGAVTSYDDDATGSVWKDNTWDDGKHVPPDRG